jgi:hypothetical protein
VHELPGEEGWPVNKPTRTQPKATLVRHTRAQKLAWEMARRKAEAEIFPNGEGQLSMQMWMEITLNAAADKLLEKKRK